LGGIKDIIVNMLDPGAGTPSIY